MVPDLKMVHFILIFMNSNDGTYYDHAGRAIHVANGYLYVQLIVMQHQIQQKQYQFIMHLRIVCLKKIMVFKVHDAYCHMMVVV